MRVTLKHLEAFIWVADLGGFKTAADRLNTTQPNISTRIANLEDIIGTPVFERRSGRISLTPKGRQLLVKARSVLAAHNEFLDLANAASSTQGTLRLGVTEMIVHTWLRPFMVALKQAFPNTVVELSVDMAKDLDRMLHARHIDLGIFNKPFDFPANSIEIGSYPMMWVASPSLGLPATIGKSDMVDQTILTHARGTWPHLVVADHFKASSARIAPSANLGTCLQMAVDGLGIAMLPHAMVAPEISDGRLVQLNYDWCAAPLEFEARFFEPRPNSPIEKAAQLAKKVAKAHNVF